MGRWEFKKRAFVEKTHARQHLITTTNANSQDWRSLVAARENLFIALKPTLPRCQQPPGYGSILHIDIENLCLSQGQEISK